MLQVFVSSTFVDLIAHRDVVLKAIRQSGADAAAMEDLGARDERALDECRRIIREFTDVFVGIYAHRYGFVPRGSDSSIIG